MIFSAFSNSTCILYFGVKFYAADPCALKEEGTRYQFFLQLKKDVLDGKLTCSFKKAAEISALALQCKWKHFMFLPCRLIQIFAIIRSTMQTISSFQIKGVFESYCNLIYCAME